MKLGDLKLISLNILKIYQLINGEEINDVIKKCTKDVLFLAKGTVRSIGGGSLIMSLAGILHFTELAMRRRFQSEKSADLRMKYKLLFKKEINQYNKKIMEEKEINYKNLLDEVTSSCMFRSIYKAVKDKMNEDKKSDGTITEDFYDARREMNYHLPWENKDGYQFITNNTNEEYQRNISRNEISIFNKLNTKKSFRLRYN